MADVAPLPILALGTRVQLKAGIGTIRYVGQSDFATGKWVGVELDQSKGKNDGTVAGKWYFECKADHGVFVRPSQITLMQDLEPTSRMMNRFPSSTAPSSPITSKPSPTLPTSHPRIASRNSLVPGKIPQQIISGRSSVASMTSGRSASPMKLPGSSISRSDTSSPAAPASLGISEIILPSPEFVGSSIKSQMLSPSIPLAVRSSSPSKLPLSSATAPSMPPSHSRILPAALALGSPRIAIRSRDELNSSAVEPLGGKGSVNLSHQIIRPAYTDLDDESGMQESGGKDDPFSLKGVESRTLAAATIPKRQHDELKAKYDLLETRRTEDRERLKELDRLKLDAMEWASARERSINKILELTTQVKDLRKQTKDLTTERDILQSDWNGLSDQIEMSVLDKELAEEQLEASKSALELARERLAEMEVESTVLKDENARRDGTSAIGTGDDTERDSLVYLQLEMQNTRLKEALIRLRDVTSAADSEQRRRIIDMEKELDLTTDLQAMYDTAVARLEYTDSQVEELKEQLDDALGAEDMLEQLTERNLTLNDRLEEALSAVEDLEAIRDLNEELEENHIEAEKQMQQEIDANDRHLREEKRRVDSLQDRVADYDSTIGQFRDLVLSLQSDLVELRNHQSNLEPNSQALFSQSQAMVSLNMKLQTSALKSQANKIELELRRLDASQSAERLSIIQPYLPPAFFEDDSDAVDALLFFTRSVYKADLIRSILELSHSVADSLASIVPDNLVVVCETRTKLARFSAVARRFATQLSRCTPELFLKMGRNYHDLLAVEKRLDHFIDALARDEFEATECGRELDGFIAQTDHLVEAYLRDPILDLAERHFSSISILDLDLDTTAASIGFTKQALALVAKDSSGSVDSDLAEFLFTPLQDLIDIARTSKVIATKLLRRFQDLISSSSALGSDHARGIDTLSCNGSAIASAASRIATEIGQYCASIAIAQAAIDLPSVIKTVSGIVAEGLGRQSSAPFDDINVLLTQLSQDLTATLAAASDADHVVLFAYTPPWISRVTRLQIDTAVNVDAQRQVVALDEDMRDLVRELRVKEQAHKESLVKIELMEKRTEAARKQSETIIELESELSKRREQEEISEEAMEFLRNNVETMAKEIVKLRAVGAPAAAPAPNGAAAEVLTYAGDMTTSQLVGQIDSLQGAVRYLRSENSYLKSQDLLSNLEELPSYCSPTPIYSVTTNDTTSASQESTVQRVFWSKEVKGLLHEARVLSATPSVVDLPLVVSGDTPGGWKSRFRAPEIQLHAEKERIRILSRKLDQLSVFKLG